MENERQNALSWKRIFFETPNKQSPEERKVFVCVVLLSLFFFLFLIDLFFPIEGVLFSQREKIFGDIEFYYNNYPYVVIFLKLVVIVWLFLAARNFKRATENLFRVATKPDLSVSPPTYKETAWSRNLGFSYFILTLSAVLIFVLALFGLIFYINNSSGY
jgi:hypothetical protein